MGKNAGIDMLKSSFGLLYTGAKILVKGKVLDTKTGAKFANSSEYKEYLNSHNKGLLLDGEDLALDEAGSFQNVAVIARIGAGKTSRYIIPNVLHLSKTKSSIVVNDPKGEVFDATSGYMASRGFKVVVIDPENIAHSSLFNPLLEAKNDIELEQIAEILVKASGSKDKDDFWQQGAMRFISLFLKVLKNAGRENPEYFTLANLYYLFQNFGDDGTNLDNFMTKHCYNPNDPFDDSLWNEYKGVLTGNKEGVQSFVLNAITSLKALTNRNIAKITSGSNINLEDLRDEKTIIYLITPAEHAEYYSFFTSLFFRSVFNSCMRKMPNRKTLPVYVLYDEFGNSHIPNFSSTANTIRGYKVSISIVLQSVAQLDVRYGKDIAKSIQGGFTTYLTYSGADPTTAEFFEKIIGRVRERQKDEFLDYKDQYREYNLMNSAEVRMIADNEVIIVSSNKQVIKLKTIPYFKNWRFKRCVRKGSVNIENDNEYIDIKYVEL
jgi:type IV secretory pathway TraG/TraD family ATPase VirD4